MNEASIKSAEFIPSLVDDLISEGRASEACEVLRDAIGSTPADDIDNLLRYKTALGKAERTSLNHHEALRVLLDAYPLLNLSRNDLFKARFHQALAITYEEIAAREDVPTYFDRAFIEYEAARHHYEEARDGEGAGYIENNIAVLNLALGFIDEAREHLRRARSYFTDPVKLAEIDKTDAEISLKENKSFEALASLLSSCGVFLKTGNKKLLDESIDTLIKAAVDYKAEKQSC